MKLTRRARIAALLLTLILLLTPAAQALTLEQARTLISQNYVDQVPDAVLSQPTIGDMLRALGDPYTEYFTPEEYQSFSASMEDIQRVGVGIGYQMIDQGMLVTQIYPSTAAQAAGMLPGDIITAADGTSTVGLSSETLQSILSGPAGSSVTFTFLRDGAQHSATLTRQPYTIPLVQSDLLDDRVGYISCSAFGDSTFGYFFDALRTYGDRADRWVVDLRSNGGGTVDAALETVNAFSGPETILYMRDNTGQVQGYGLETNALTAAPAIVLTNQYSASSSELFSAAIRDHGSGILVGGRTYGKGVSQRVYDQSTNPDYFPDGSALKITANRFYSPDGATNDTIGVIPHLLVDETLALDVARLLSPTAPAGDNSRYLRMDKGWIWYIDLDAALTPALRPALVALLEATPSNTWLGRGTGSDWADTTVSALVEQLQLTEYRPRGFTDSSTSPYGKYLDILATYGILKGTGDGTFQPGNTLTRAQLCALLAQALNCATYTGETYFSDVAPTDWYYDSVNAMAKLGLVSGTGDGTFRPGDPVDHQQLIAIMARLSQRANLFFDLSAENMPANGLPDPAGYAAWAQPGLWLLSRSQDGFFGNKINLLWAEAAEIPPTAAATREEAAALLYNVLSYTGILPA